MKPIIDPSIKSKIRAHLIPFTEHPPAKTLKGKFPGKPNPDFLVVAEVTYELTTGLISVKNKRRWKKLGMTPYKVIGLSLCDKDIWEGLVPDDIVLPVCIMCGSERIKPAGVFIKCLACERRYKKQ
jgi:hypothetical protein